MSTDSSIQAWWDLGPDTMWGYTVLYSDDTSSAFYDNGVTVGDTNQVELLELPPGRWYKLAVTCFDSLDNASELSEPVYVLLVADTANNPPQITTTDPPGKARVGQEYSFALSAEDLDGDPITFIADSVPNGYILVDSLATWTPDSSQMGPYFVRLIADDGQGGRDSIEYVIVVWSASASLGSVDFSRTTYYSETDAAVLYISDMDLDIAQADIDSASAVLSSTSDPDGGVNIVDLTHLVAYLFGGGPEPVPCP